MTSVSSVINILMKVFRVAYSTVWTEDTPEAFTQRARRCWRDSLSMNIIGPDQADRGVRRWGKTTCDSTLRDTSICNADCKFLPICVTPFNLE